MKKKKKEEECCRKDEEEREGKVEKKDKGERYLKGDLIFLKKIRADFVELSLEERSGAY